MALLDDLQRLHASMVNVALYGTDGQRADLRVRIALLGADDTEPPREPRRPRHPADQSASSAD